MIDLSSPVFTWMGIVVAVMLFALFAVVIPIAIYQGIMEKKLRYYSRQKELDDRSKNLAEREIAVYKKEQEQQQPKTKKRPKPKFKMHRSIDDKWEI